MSSDDLRAWVDAGLYEPDDDPTGERAELIRFFASVGLTPTDLEAGGPEGLIHAASERLYRPGERMDADEAARRSGLDRQTFGRLARASGYASDADFTELDVEAFRSFAIASELFSVDALLDFSRSLAGAMARVADAASGLVRIDVTPQVEADGGSDLDFARMNVRTSEMTRALFPPMRAFFAYQLMESARVSDEGRAAVTSGAITTIKVAVGFVDVVGYTEMSASLGADELADYVSRLEATAFEIVAERGGRLAKLIGDAVMFVTVAADDAVTIACDLVQAFDVGEAAPRGGLAHGEVVARGGDYHGPVVNLASRIADLAVPGELLLDAAMVAACRDATGCEPAGRRQLKGFAEPIPLWSIAAG